jgi:hypothetical protein
VVGEFDIVPTGNFRVLIDRQADRVAARRARLRRPDHPVGLRPQRPNGSNWGNWNDEGPCCKAGNTPDIVQAGWRYVIYLR